MKLSRLFSEERIALELPASTSGELIEQTLAEIPDADFAETSRDDVIATLLERDQPGSLVVQDVLLPHARIEGLEHAFIAVGIPEFPFEASSIVEPDEKATVLLGIVICVPKTQNTLMLQTMAAVQRLLSEQPARTLVGIKSPAKFIRHVEDTGIDIKKILIAADIMTDRPAWVTPEMKVGEAVRRLVEARADTIAVVNDGELPIGELRSMDILSVGVPKHLSLLSDPTLLDQFEAFEKYFEQEMSLTVSDVMAREITTVSPEDSVMSVAQRFIKEKRRKIYVVEDEKLIGEIRPRDVVIRVLGV